MQTLIHVFPKETKISWRLAFKKKLGGTKKWGDIVGSLFNFFWCKDHGPVVQGWSSKFQKINYIMANSCCCVPMISKKNCLNLSGFAKATLPKFKKFKIPPEKWPKPKRKGERFPTIVFSGGELLNFRKGFLPVWWDLMGSWLPWIERSILGFHHWKICPKKEGKSSIGWLKKLGAPLTKTTPDIPSHQKKTPSDTGDVW